MTGNAKPPFAIRAAQMREAAAICAVLRRSIVELCERDHHNDPARLAEWLADEDAGERCEPDRRSRDLHDFQLAAGYADDGARTAYEPGDWPHMQKEPT